MENLYVGEGMGQWGALAYQLDALLLRSCSPRYIRWAVAFISRFLFGWLKWLDHLPPNGCERMLATAGITFIGRKRETPYHCREILEELQRLYGWGAVDL